MMVTNTSGILFGDIFVNNKTLFINFFANYYQQNSTQINAVISSLQMVLNDMKSAVTPSSSKAFEMAWAEFEATVLLNAKPLQLLVAYRGHEGRYSQLSQIITQSEVQETAMSYGKRRYGINSGNEVITASMAVQKAQEVEDFLRLHLDEYLQQLNTMIGEDDANKLYTYHQNYLIKYFKQKKDNDASLASLAWREPFYGRNSKSYFAGQGLGQAYDAFMNHIANYHRQVYTYLDTQGTANAPLNLRGHSSVFEEEGGASQGGTFPKLLYESTNRIGWYTGGDIIIVNPKTMEIIYNIQLKTTTARTQSLFAIKIAELSKFINEFASSLYSPEQKAEQLFNFFLTSVSNNIEFNKVTQADIDGMILKAFNKFK